MDNNNFYNQQQPQQNYNQPYQQPYGVQNEQPMSLGDWIVTLLIMMIPCVNIIMMFVWAFGSNVNTSKKNYFRASLIFAAVGLVLGLILSSIISSMMSNLAYGLFY